MKHIRLFGLLAICFLLACNETNQAKSSLNAANNKSLLWKIQKKGSAKPSYLFGTVHMICPEDYLWTNAMKESLQKTDEVCFEMDMDDPSVMIDITMAMIDNSGKKLSEYFTPDQYKRLEKFMLDSMQTNLASMQQMKPAVLYTMLATRVLDCPNTVSYETKIMEEAQKEHKNIIGLEQAKEQIALFDSIPVDSMVDDIMHAVSGVPESKTEFTKLIDAYKKQDLPKVYDLMQQSEDLKSEMGAFLDERNKKWISRMEEKMNGHSVFFAVGAGHLWGQNGVIQLLRNAGYTVEPVR